MTITTEKPLPVWINRIGARTPLIFLTDTHIINNLRFLKRKALRDCGINKDRWEQYAPNIYYDVLEEADKRGLDYESALMAVTEARF